MRVDSTKDEWLLHSETQRLERILCWSVTIVVSVTEMIVFEFNINEHIIVQQSLSEYSFVTEAVDLDVFYERVWLLAVVCLRQA